MTQHTAKNYLPLIQSWIEGKQLQKFSGGQWRDFEPNSEVSWKFPHQAYRVKPEPKLRPWKPEEVPVGALIKDKKVEDLFRTIISTVTNEGDIINATGGKWSAKQYLNEWMHSIDHGKTWLPCGVMEE